jgi:hypothetical protein
LRTHKRIDGMVPDEILEPLLSAECYRREGGDG